MEMNTKECKAENAQNVCFDGLTVVILASNERESLRDTIQMLAAKCCPDDLKEIIVFLKSETCAAAETMRALIADNTIQIPIRIVVQKSDTLHKAVSEIPDLINSSHLLIMFADLATSPDSVPEMIKESKERPGAIVCASKWHIKSDVKEYGFLRMLCSRLMNLAVAAVLHSDGRDLFSLFQIVPMSLIRELSLSNSSQFAYEYLLKPIAIGAEYIEIPTKYIRRKEDKSNIQIPVMFRTAKDFFFTALRLRREFGPSKRNHTGCERKKK